MNVSTAEMTELELKKYALSVMKRRYNLPEDAIVVDEFRFVRGRYRADLAIATASSLLAVEVKSAADSVKNLERQVRVYSKYFHKVSVWVDGQHMESIKKLEFPMNCEVSVVLKSKTKLIKRGRIEKNKSAQVISQLLNDNEIERLIKRECGDDLKHCLSSDLISKLGSKIIMDSVRRRMRKILLDREENQNSSHGSSPVFPSGSP